MAEIINMPKLGFDMAEGTLVRWVHNEGEEIAKGEVLAEIETDKATVEVESTHAGVIRRLLVEPGTSVPVGTAIAVVGTKDEPIELEKTLPAREAEKKPVVAAPGAPPAAERKAVAPSPATPYAAPPQAPHPAAPAVQAAEAEAPEGRLPEGRLPEGVRASPLARRIATERGIDLGAVAGSGPGGRVVKRDLETAPAPTAGPAGVLAPLPSLMPAPREDRRVPLKRLRQTIGRRMGEAKQQIPHFYVTHEFDMGPLMALREQINEVLPEDEKLSVNDFLVRASALTLRQFPNLNASIEGQEIIEHGAIHIGVAVAVEGGLLTVVSRDSDLKPLRLISAELREMVARARQGKVRQQDVEGSTFTLSNMGMYDVEHFIAIINPPEAAILAVGSVMDVPVVTGGQVTVGQRMKATLSADHRITDGAEVARFLQAMAAYVEEPVKLLI